MSVEIRKGKTMMREADLRDTLIVIGSLVLAIGMVWYIMLLP
jgi:hypothetical protein